MHKNLTPAQVQGYFMRFKNKPTEALKNIEHFYDTTNLVKF